MSRLFDGWRTALRGIETMDGRGACGRDSVCTIGLLFFFVTFTLAIGLMLGEIQ